MQARHLYIIFVYQNNKNRKFLKNGDLTIMETGSCSQCLQLRYGIYKWNSLLIIPLNYISRIFVRLECL